MAVEEFGSTGVRFLAGTDRGGVPYLYYGFSLHDELALLVEAGFTPLEALQAATRNAAEFLGLKDTGTIEPNRRADLVLLAADPLADSANRMGSISDFQATENAYYLGWPTIFPVSKWSFCPYLTLLPRPR